MKNIRWLLLLLLILCLLVSCNTNRNETLRQEGVSEPGAQSGSVVSSSYPQNEAFLHQSQALVFSDTTSGMKMPYRIYVPPRYDAEKSYPLLLWLHGAGDFGTDNEKQALGKPILESLTTSPYKEQYPCIIIAPQCPVGGYWSDDKSWRNESNINILNVLYNLIGKVEDEYSVDANRLYITGFSMGGFGTYNMLQRYPERFAAAVPVAGWGDESQCAGMTHTPIWAFHGAADQNIPAQLDKNMVYAIRQAGGKIRYTEYPGEGHDCTSKAYAEQEFIPWLFSEDHITAES